MREIPQDILQKAAQLRKDNYSWKRIAKHLKYPLHPLQMKLDPAYRERKRVGQLAARTPVQDFDYTTMLPKEDGITRNPKYDPRVHGTLEWENQQAFMLGDPPIGRRAIDLIDKNNLG